MSGMAAALAESLQLKRTFFAAHGEAIAAQARRLAAALQAGGKLLAFGNGGSAADARRAAACLLENGFPAVPLASFAGNPLSFAELYRALRRPGDCAMAISTSGNSANVLDAVRAARGLGDPVIALTGKGGGHLLGLVPDALVVPSASTQRIQEVHIMIVHELCALAIAECGMRNAE